MTRLLAHILFNASAMTTGEYASEYKDKGGISASTLA